MPRKPLMSLPFSGWNPSITARVLCSWVWMPSLSISKPQKSTFWHAQANFAHFALTPCSVSTVSTSRTCRTCSARLQLWIIISSRYTTMNLYSIGSKTPFIMPMDWLGAFPRPNGMTRHSYTPNLVVKAVFCLSAVVMCIWWWAAARSNFVNKQELGIKLGESSMSGRG